MIRRLLATGSCAGMLFVHMGAAAFAHPGHGTATPPPDEAAAAVDEPQECPYEGTHPSIEEGDEGDVKGEAIEHAQCLLNELGYDVPEDGEFGPETDEAVRQLKSYHDLRGDNGEIGPCTWAVIHAAFDYTSYDPDPTCFESPIVGSRGPN